MASGRARDPLTTDADTLFTELGVREVEEYAAHVSRLTHEKQQAARTLVGGRYRDLLSVARTVGGMAESLAALHATGSALDTAMCQAKEQAFMHAEHLLAPRSAVPTCELDVAAALMLLADAPEIARAALRQRSLFGAAWAGAMDAQAWAWLGRQGPTYVALFPLVATQRNALDAACHEIMACASRRMAEPNTRASDVLDALVARSVLAPHGGGAALDVFLTQRLATARTTLAGAKPMPVRFQALMALVAKTLRHVAVLFDDGAFAHVMNALEGQESSGTSRFFAVGAAQALADSTRSTYAPVDAPWPRHLSAELRQYVPHAEWDISPDARVAQWLANVRTALAAVDMDVDLDAVATCRRAIGTTYAECVRRRDALDALSRDMGAMLNRRVHVLVQHALEEVSHAFGEAFDTELKCPAPAEVFAARPQVPCIALFEDRLRRVAQTTADTPQGAGNMTAESPRDAALAAACASIADRVEHAADKLDTIDAQAALLRVCAAMYESRTLRRHADATFPPRVAATFARVGATWATAAAQTLVHRAAATTTRTPLIDYLCRGARAFQGLGASSLPPPPLLAALVTAWAGAMTPGAAARADAALAAFLLEGDTSPAADNARAALVALEQVLHTHGLANDAALMAEAGATVARLRLVLIPWALDPKRRLPRATSANNDTHIARVAPRFHGL